MGLASKRIVYNRWPLVAGMILAARVAHAQQGPAAPTASAAASAPAPSASAPAPAGQTPAAPSASPNAPAPPPAPSAPPGSAPPPPGYTVPAYVGPYGPPQYYGEPPLPPEPPPDNRTLSLTLSPLHLLIGPIIELEGEFRVANHVGVALIGGYGELSATTTYSDGTSATTKFTTFEIGSQLNVYPSKPFKGLDLGVEVMYLKINTDKVADTQFSGIGVGLAAGPLVGYKLITDGGFTFVAQGGLQVVVVQAEVRDPNGVATNQNDHKILPNLNLNLGWSF